MEAAMQKGSGLRSTTTPYMGVSNYNNCVSKPFYAMVRRLNLTRSQSFATAEEAARARDEWFRQSVYAKQVRYNFPEVGEPGIDGQVRNS